MTTLTLVIPVYNEQERLQKTFATLNAWRVPVGMKVDRVIFVNDGSTDSSIKLLRATPLKFSRKVINYKTNQGKGHAVKRGMLASSSDYTLLLDADMATDPAEVKKFLPLMKKNFDVIIGTRKNGHSTVTVHQPVLRENMGKIFTKLSQLTLGVQVTDFTCGFKAFSRQAKNPIFKRSLINRWGYDSEILFLASKLGYSLVEKSVSWADQKGTKVSLAKDSIKSLEELLQVYINALKGLYQLESTTIPTQPQFAHLPSR